MKLPIKNIVTSIAILAIVFSLHTFATPTQVQAADTTNLQELLQTIQERLLELQNTNDQRVLGASLVRVSNDQELLTALRDVTGGEVIKLAPGSYGNIIIRDDQYGQIHVGSLKVSGGPNHTRVVRIESEEENNPAIIEKIEIISSSNWHINNVNVIPAGTIGLYGTAVSMSGDNNVIENSLVDYGDYADWSAAEWLENASNGISVSGNNALVKNNTLRAVNMGIVAGGSQSTGALIINNTVDGIRGDGGRVLQGGSTFKNNLFTNFVKVDGNHDDCIQSWASKDGRPNQEAVMRDVTIQNNICINSDNEDLQLASSPQGYAIFDGISENWLVENNVLITSHYHGISLYGARNNTIKNNTVISDATEGKLLNKLWIMLSSNKSKTVAPTGNTVVNNVANTVNAVANNSYSGNRKVTIAEYDNLFQDWRTGDVRPKSGQLTDGAGARLNPSTVGSDVDSNRASEIVYTEPSEEPVEETETEKETENEDDFTIPKQTVERNDSVLRSARIKATNSTLFNAEHQPDNLTDRCLSTTPSDRCTTGTDEANVMVIEYDLDGTYDLNLLALHGDAHGTWVSKTWSVQYSLGDGDWKYAFKDKTAEGNTWFEQSVDVSNVTALRLTVTGANDTKKVQAQEFAAYGTAVTPEEEAESEAEVQDEVEDTVEENVSETKRIQVTDTVNVRARAGGEKKGLQLRGATGSVDTTRVRTTAGGYRWVYIDFDQGVDGYVAESFVRNLDNGNAPVSLSTMTREEIIELIKQLIALIMARST